MGMCSPRKEDRVFLVFLSMILIGVFTLTGSQRAYGEAALDWQVKVYGDGTHNAFTDLIRWHDQYYLCFRHGASHLSMDGEIRVMRSSDLKSWESCGTLDTFGDDRDPHFTATDKTLYVFFGVWDLSHAKDNGVPVRNRLRSHFASSEDGQHWSDIRGIYESDWWLWRVRWIDDAFYSVGYAISWPAMPSPGEARLLRSQDGLNWSAVSTITRERIPDEADVRRLPDKSMEVVIRTGDSGQTAMLLRSDPACKEWQRKDLNALIHSPVMATWKNRCFVAGRGAAEQSSVTRVWELTGDTVRELITLPSSGDTAYPGLVVDPETATGDYPALFVSWYSQHERKPETPNEASIYVGRVSVKP